MTTIEQLGARAKAAKAAIAAASTGKKNECLEKMADALWAERAYLIAENEKDLAAGRANGMNEGLLDRLALNEKRIAGICDGLRQVAALDDPVGIIDSGWTRPNGLRIVRTRVPMGVVGIIYESRPNVTADGAALCLKSGNACILRGGKEAIRSNKALADIMRKAIESCGLPADILLLVEDISRETATAMMKLNGYLDVLIPRGGAGLIRSVVQNATVPVIETGTGNCHIYVEKTADPEMALNILENAKTSRISVCNAAESLLIDEEAAEKLLPLMKERLDKYSVTWYGCERTREILPGILPAGEEEFGKEFLDYAISCKVVSGVDEAIAHIARYSTGHSEAIITNDLSASEKFLDRVDSAAVYVNASTRFTDGGEFGFGAEIGISTQKLHARGPMGLAELTTMKYKVYGSGQIR
ncbi:MAG: glutamate-5-semialdehyde dehydrogenase [Oscillospiraceae bacterium]|nr:glutamate-5-semialdehyde dehydrogenase [Oscillospiraceae bacterium]